MEDVLFLCLDAAPVAARVFNMWLLVCAISRLGVQDEDGWSIVDSAFRILWTGVAYGLIEYQFHYLTHLWKSKHHVHPEKIEAQVLNEMDMMLFSAVFCVMAWLQVFYVATLNYFVEWYVINELLHYVAHHP